MEKSYWMLITVNAVGESGMMKDRDVEHGKTQLYSVHRQDTLRDHSTIA